MKKKTIIRYSLLFVLLFAAAALYYGYNELNRKTKSVTAQKADFSLKQEVLLQEFAADEKAATQKYSGKVLEIFGSVKAVETNASGYTTVVLGDSASLASIRCSIDSTQIQTATTLQPNSTISIKGICTGYNADELGLGADVILNRCVFVKP